MNTDNLHALIDRYEENMDKIYSAEHDELFKWRALKTWQQEWNKPEGFPSFAERFIAAKKDFYLFIDNSRMHPSAGVLKLWEKEPDTVEYLFDQLFADTGASIPVTQKHMDLFLDSYEALRQRYFPGNWSYKQDRHSASVFLAMNNPDFNFVYKSSEALTIARYIGFDHHIGTGTYFSLDNYYRLCYAIISALQEHERLLEKHFSKLSDACYNDKSLHLLAFDLMYCSRTYNYYKGLVVPSIGKPKKEQQPKTLSMTEMAEREKERLAQINAIELEIEALERNTDGCEDISLIGVQVTSTQYGTGVVIEQEVNKIVVQYDSIRKSFILDKKYPARPRFEDDDSIIEAFTTYGHAQERIRQLQRKLKSLG